MMAERESYENEVLGGGVVLRAIESEGLFESESDRSIWLGIRGFFFNNIPRPKAAFLHINAALGASMAVLAKWL